MRSNQSLSQLSAHLLDHFDNYLRQNPCDLIVGQGDTTTTLISAVSAFYHHISFAHIEAGLRTSHIDNPFPEEFNRRVTSLIAALHFCPTDYNAKNLLAEGIKERVYVTGNTIIDHLYECARTIPLTARKQKLILVTCHRRENFGAPLINICLALQRLAQRNKDIEIVLPVHPNPNVKKVIESYLSQIDNIILSPPLEYPQLVALIKNCYLVLTDSGGLQEEAPALHKPVLVLRTETERIEAISCGAAMLVGIDTENIIQQVETLLHDETRYHAMCNVDSPYGDGQAAERIVQEIIRYLLGKKYDIPNTSKNLEMMSL